MQNTPVKIVVFGTINKDLILPFEGASIQSFGGIYYSITALSNLGQDQVEIIPVSFVGEDSFSNLLALIKSYNNINRKGLIEINQKNHEVILEYSSPEVRKERHCLNFPLLNGKILRACLRQIFMWLI
jgi:hypothetical protein